MNTLHSFFTWTIDTSLRASLLAAAVMLIQAALRGHISARWRYALWLPVLFVLVAPVLPQSRWSVESVFAPKVISLPPMSQWSGGVHLPAPTDLPLLDLNLTAEPTAKTEMDWTQVLVIAWLLGVIVCIVGGAGYYLATMSRFRRTAVPVDTALLNLVQTLSAEMLLRRAPPVLMSPRIDSPAVAGLWWPQLLLPADFSTAFTETEATLVLKHELMHLKRCDLPVNALLCMLQALHWFNPMLWSAAARARQDRETACDAMVLASAVRDCRNDYGHALLKVQSAYCPRGFSLGLVGILDGSTAVRARITAIANHRRVHPLMGWVSSTLIAALVMLGATHAEPPDIEKPTPRSDSTSNPNRAPVEKVVVPVPPRLRGDSVGKASVPVSAEQQPGQAPGLPPLILIDPGHGGVDLGAKSGTLNEAALVLALSNKVAAALRTAGLRVEMTRTTDQFVALLDRAAMANQLKPALFLSLHINTSNAAASHGYEVFGPMDTGLGALFAKALGDEEKTTVKAKKTTSIKVIQESTVPSLLLEAGYLSNEADARRVNDDAESSALAGSIARAVITTLKGSP